jgi:cell wall-associated NlpC family hydrolase
MGKPAAIGTALATVIILLVTRSATAVVQALFGTDSSPSPAAIADIPADYLAFYQTAAKNCPGLDWSILAAIGKIETNHGRSRLPGVHSGENHAGAGGPMQFLKPTWDGVLARHQIPPGGATPPSRYNPHDAIHAAAFLLCDNNDSRNLRTAIWNYNHSDDYVSAVLAQAEKYRSVPATTGAPTPAALVAVNYAQQQLDLPYRWGGDGMHEGGFDCSGLTHAAYATAGVTIPRTAQTQYNAGPRIPAGTPLLPGDLIFYSNSSGRITHVGIAISSTQMINAPYTGAVIRIDPIGRYTGATRPAASVTA